MTEEILFNEIPKQKRLNRSIAVQLHLYYVDLLEEFCEYLSNIPYPFDLYVSVQKGEDTDAIEKRLKRIKNVSEVIVRENQNRGRDIAPVYVLFREEIEKHDYFLHVHSKKSMYRGSEQSTWRRGMLEGVLGSSSLIKRIFYLFENNDPKIGLFFPETIELPLMAHGWLKNERIGKELLASFGYHPYEDLFNYPTGSFFWAKIDAVRPLFDRKFTYEDFPEEKGQTDGTLAHALERVVAHVCRGRGYEFAIGDNRDKMVRIGNSYKLYRPNFNADIEDVCKELKRYSIVSFDIFDTLITRKIYEPDDLFIMMGEIINKRYRIACNFLEARKKAEEAANKKLGAKTTIHDIYAELQDNTVFTKQIAEDIKQLEIDLELELAIPRKEVVKVYNELLRVQKRIILTSDMYLTSDIVKRLLDKCGITGYEELYISCETGLRKDNGTMWAMIVEKYKGADIIHVGDNLTSDIQLAGDVLKSTYYIINPRTAFKLCETYREYQEPINNRTISTSLALGKIINELLYNNPFNLRGNGVPVIEDGSDAGAIIAGAVFTCFLQHIVIEQPEDAVLLFLSREGYALQTMYEAYCEGKGIKPLESHYFLSSRRAASVSALKDTDDMEILFEQDFDGKYKVFLDERFGIDISDEKFGQEEIHLPEQKQQAKLALKPYYEQILMNSEKEREAYLSYIYSLISDDKLDKAVVVDLGYSGTIQYYLSKLLDKKISGAYMCTGRNVRPEKLGCRVNTIYDFDYKTYEIHGLQHESAFLEAILEAPYGQLKCFKQEDGKSIPQYKESKPVGNNVVLMQQGISDFAKDIGYWEKITGLDLLIDSKEAFEIMKRAIRSDAFAEKVLEQLKVEDGYTLGGELHFSRNGGRYLIVDGKRHEVAAHDMRVYKKKPSKTMARNLQNNFYGLYIFLRKFKGLITGHGFRVVGEL